MRKGFLIFNDIGEHLRLLSDEQVGKLFRGLVEYSTNGTPFNTDDLAIRVLFSVISQQVDQSADHYEKVCEERRKAGQKGGLARAAKQIQANQAIATFAKQNQANQAKNKIKNNNKNKIKNNIDNIDMGADKSAHKTTRFVPPTIEEVEAYISEKGYNVDAVKFWNFYESKGWMVGKNKMKSWRSSVATWAREDRQRNNSQGMSTGIVLTDNSESKYDNSQLWGDSYDRF